MALLTTWGYTLTGVDSLENFMTVEEFDTFTDRKYSRNYDKISAEISAACAAVRNFVGWHLGPSLACELSATFLDQRVSRVGGDALIQLPARYVTEVESVQIDGTECEAYVLDPSGLLRVIGAWPSSYYAPVKVAYTAGLPEVLMAPIKELIAHRVTHAVAVPSGITSEASGGVSVTYNANWINNSRATALAGDNKEMLIPYRVQGVF